MTEPTPLEIANAACRAEIAERFRREYDEALALAESVFGPGWEPCGRHMLVEKDEEERARKAGDRAQPAATVYSARNKDGGTRHFVIEKGVPREVASVEEGFGDMYHEKHPTRGFEHRGQWIPWQRYSLHWGGYELYTPQTAEQLAAARLKREAKAVEKEAQVAPLFADLIREEGYVKPKPRRGR